MPREHLLFVYGTELPGEDDHALLEGATLLGPATTEPQFDLVDLGARAALVAGGLTAVMGELYSVPVAILADLDRRAGHPILYRRTPLRLADGRTGDAYMLEADQVRGRRRVRSGDWRARNRRTRTTDGGSLVRWARTRKVE
jgi:gamma-glutamylcyclotransferase (GGCT)/AIG2-like uncharacterized protein YtfP